MKKEKNDKKNDERIDPALVMESGVPNICFTEWNSVEYSVEHFNDKMTAKQKKTTERYAKQRMKRGFDSSEVEGLEETIAKFLVPRLKAFRTRVKYDQAHWSFPYTGMDSIRNKPEWVDILNKMIEGFSLVIYKYDRIDKWIFLSNEEMERRDKTIKDAAFLLGKYYTELFL